MESYSSTAIVSRSTTTSRIPVDPSHVEVGVCEELSLKGRTGTVLSDLDRGGLLAQFESVLLQQEAALNVLQKLALEQRDALVSREPEGVLELLQRIEEVLGRIGQLETARSCLSDRLAVADGSAALAASSGLVPGGPSATAHLGEMRRRIFAAAGRIAELNEANRHLATSLARFAEVASTRLLLLQEASASGQTVAPLEPGAIQPSEVKTSRRGATRLVDAKV